MKLIPLYDTSKHLSAALYQRFIRAKLPGPKPECPLYAVDADKSKAFALQIENECYTIYWKTISQNIIDMKLYREYKVI